MENLNLLESKIENSLQYTPVYIEPEELPAVIDDEKFIDLLLEINSQDIISADLALDDLKSLELITNLELKGLVYASMGYVQADYGDNVNAANAFKLANNLVQTYEGYAFIVASMATMLRIEERNDEAVELIDLALENVENERLKWRLKWQKALCNKESDPDNALNILEKAVAFYEKIKNLHRANKLKKHIAHIFLVKSKFKQAETLYNSILHYALENNFLHLHADVVSDMGWAAYLQKDYETARSKYKGLIQTDLIPYQLSLCLQNMGMVELDTKNYDNSIRCFSRSLSLSLHYGMREMMFEDYYYLGLCYEKTGNNGLAEHFYHIGYKEVLKDIERRFPFVGYRKKIMTKYLSFLKNNQQLVPLKKEKEIFGFALGKTLNEIRNVFYSHFFNMQLGRTKNAVVLCKKLAIERVTYYQYQKKLGLKRGFKKPVTLEKNRYFMHYLESLDNKTWVAVKAQFETDLLMYLLEQHQYNKKELAKILGITYQHLSLLTA